MQSPIKPGAARILALALLAAAPVFRPAATRAEEPKNRMVFSLDGGGPISSPTPQLALSTAEAGPARTPDESVKLFFAALQGGDVDAAYDALVKGTIIAERPEDVTSLKERTKQALDGYGPIGGYEMAAEQRVGEHLLRKTCISLNEDLPLRWRFYFYRAGADWKLVDLRVDDALVELFEDSARAQK